MSSEPCDAAAVPSGKKWCFKPSSFVSHTLFNCVRKLQLDANEARREADAPSQSVGSQHTARGHAFEAEVVAFERARGLIVDFPEALASLSDEKLAAQALQDLVLSIPHGETRFIYQPLIVVPSALQGLLRSACAQAAPSEHLAFSRTFPDLIKVSVSSDGTCRDLTVIDVKSSVRAKVGHRMQIAFYAMCLEVIFKPSPDDKSLVRVSSEGEVWLPKKAAGWVTDEADDSAGRAQPPLGPYRIDVFAIQKHLIVDYFKGDLPRAMRGDGEWDFQPSCRGCPHLATCKAAILDKAKEAPTASDDAQATAYRSGKPILRPTSEPCLMVHAPRDVNSTVAVVIKSSVSSSPAASSFAGAFVALRPATAAQLEVATQVATDRGLDPREALVTAHVETVEELCELLYGRVVEGGGDVATWDADQKSLLLESIKAAGPLDSRRSILLQLLWEDFDTLREEVTDAEFGRVHYLSRRCYAVKDVLEGLYCLPFPGPTTFEEARMLFRPSKWFPVAPAPVLETYVAAEFKKLPIQPCLQDAFTMGPEATQPLALVADMWNLLGLAIEPSTVKDHLRPYPLKQPPSQAPQPLALAPPSNDIKLSLMRFVARQTVYSSCCKATDTWLEGDMPIQLVYAPRPTLPRPLADDVKLGLCRFRLVFPSDATRISPSGLSVEGDADQGDEGEAEVGSLEDQLDGLAVSSPNAPPRASTAPVKCPGCKQTQPIGMYRASLVEHGGWRGLWGLQCPSCNATTDADQCVPAIKAKFGDYVLSRSLAGPGRDEDECSRIPVSRGHCLRDVCDVIAVTCEEEDGQWYVYVARAFMLLKQGKYTAGEPAVLHKRYVDFNTKVLREMVLDDPSEALKSPLLDLVVKGSRRTADENGTPCTAVAYELALPLGAALSVEQDDAIRHSTGKAPLTILWGPPGTGKTSTVGVMLATWLRVHSNLRVIVVATTKDALAAVSRALARHATPHTVIDSFSKLGAAQKRQFAKGRGTVFLSTVWQAAKLLKEKGGFEKFDALVIDEASQMTVAQALLASLLLDPSPTKHKIVIAGDLLQLPPIQEDVTPFLQLGCCPELFSARHSVMQAAMATATGGRLLHSFGAGRADQQWLNVVQLRKSFRSVKEIVDFVGCSYPLGMEAHKGAAAVNPLRTVCLADGERAAEADYITSFLTGLFSAGHGGKNVTVVCTHRLQRYALRSKIQFKPWSSRVVVETTEKTQGSEADVVVIAFGGGVKYGSPFPFDFNRLNVAISRAKEQAVLVVSSAFPFEVAASEHFPDARHAAAAHGLALLQRFVAASAVTKVPAR